MQVFFLRHFSSITVHLLLIFFAGSQQDIYVARPSTTLPDWVASGDVLVGTLKLDKDKAVSSMEVLYIAPPKPTKKKDENKSDSKDPDGLEDVVFKAKLDYIAGLRTKNSALYKETAALLKDEKPGSVPLLTELLTFALESSKPSDEEDEDKWRAKEIDLVYEAMQKVNNGPIDTPALAQYFGLNEPSAEDLEADEEAKKLNKEMKDQRSAYKKVLLARASIAGKVADKDASFANNFDEAVKEMKLWVKSENLEGDDDKTKLAITESRHSRICQNRMGTALSILLKAKKDLNGKGAKQIDEELSSFYALSNMEHLAEYSKEEAQNRFPAVKRSV